MTIHELIKTAVKKLTNSTSPELDGEVLLSFVVNKPKEYLLANPFAKVSAKNEKNYFRLINKRLLGWPVAYLTKSKEFFGLNFYVDKNVLIPRPETEGLVELVLNHIKGKNNLKILDVGTGSGCIIISIAKNARGHKYFGSDISPKAISIAKKNAKKHKVKVTFDDGNLLEPMKKFKFDLIVANLPYLYRRTDESTKFEPTGALIAAKKGIKIYEQFLKQISELSAAPSALFLEIGRDQGPIIKKLAKKFLPAYKVKIFKDLFGRTRYAVFQKVP